MPVGTTPCGTRQCARSTYSSLLDERHPVSRSGTRELAMEITYTHVAGLDIHKQTVVACTFTPGPKGKPHKQIRTFGTTTQDLLALATWLTSLGITHVAMESTGEYWKPVYNLLEGSVELLVVNAQH